MKTRALRSMEVGDDPRAVDVEAEPKLLETARHHRLDDPALVLRARVEHEKAAASRAHQFPSDGPGFAGRVVVLIDDRIGHFRGELSLVRPVLVEKLPVGVDVAGHEDAMNFAP